MKFVILLVLIYLAYNIIRTQDYERFKFIFLGFVFFPSITPIPSAGLDAHRFLILSFLFSLFVHNEFKKIRSIPLAWILLLMLISGFLTGYMDSRISAFSKFWKPFSRFLVEFGLVYIGYCTFLTLDAAAKMERLLVRVALIVGAYGLLTLIVGTDVYGLIMSTVIDESFTDFTPTLSGRMRICSFLMNSHIYGSYCCSMGLFMSYIQAKRGWAQIEKLTFVLMIIGLLISGSRSSLMGFVIGEIILIVFSSNANTFVKRIAVIVISAFFVCQIPMVKDKVISITSLFNPNAEQTSGSTIEGREMQYDVSMQIFSLNPIWGNGYDYWGEVTANDEYWKKEGIYGAESYIFILLIERGLVQIIIILVFTLLLLFLLLLKSKKVRLENVFALSLFICFVSISIMTGNTGKWPLFLPLLGLFLNTDNVEYFKNLYYYDESMPKE